MRGLWWEGCTVGYFDFGVVGRWSCMWSAMLDYLPGSPNPGINFLAPISCFLDIYLHLNFPERPPKPHQRPAQSLPPPPLLPILSTKRLPL